MIRAFVGISRAGPCSACARKCGCTKLQGSRTCGLGSFFGCVERGFGFLLPWLFNRRRPFSVQWQKRDAGADIGRVAWQHSHIIVNGPIACVTQY